MKTECCLLSFFICTATTITEGPVSVTALVGTNAQFHCAGTGNYLVWEVDGLASDHPDVLARGITSDTTTTSGTVQSTLTVLATSVNNGTTVRCAISISLFSTPVISSYSTLTVLPGEQIKVKQWLISNREVALSLWCILTKSINNFIVDIYISLLAVCMASSRSYLHY